MKLEIAAHRDNHLVEELLNIWEASVRATHDFLHDADIRAIKEQARQGIAEIELLFYASGENGNICGFMGVDKDKIEMLFVHPARMGTGIGKMFINYAVDNLQAVFVDVNEQNPQALGFYKHLGFKVISRSPLDSAGNPFPILHMGR